MVATLLTLPGACSLTDANAMLVDLALLGSYNTLRIQGWIGNFALMIETGFIGQGSLTVRLREEHGRFKGFEVETHLRRLGDGLLLLQDRSHRLVLRTFKALDERRRRPGLAVTVGQAGQVNVASQQANAVMGD